MPWVLSWSVEASLLGVGGVRGGGVGMRVALPDGLDPFVGLFSESAERVLVAVPPAAEAAFTAFAMIAGHG